jgi:integrase
MFIQSKTKRRVEVPIHPAFQAWLAQIPEEGRVGNVFPSLAEKTSAGRNGLSGQFRLIMEKAGVKGEIIERKGDKGRNRSTLSFHSLRHSFNSAMANAGIPQEMRQRLTGHASEAVNDRYTHAELESLRKAVETVPSVS